MIKTICPRRAKAGFLKTIQLHFLEMFLLVIFSYSFLRNRKLNDSSRFVLKIVGVGDCPYRTPRLLPGQPHAAIPYPLRFFLSPGADRYSVSSAIPRWVSFYSFYTQKHGVIIWFPKWCFFGVLRFPDGVLGAFGPWLSGHTDSVPHFEFEINK